MTRKQKNLLRRILLAATLLLLLAFLPVEGLARFFLYLIPYFLIGYDILRKAGKGLYNRRLLDENFLMAVATLGALVLGLTQTGDYVEAVAVMLFYQTGEFFQSYAVGKSRRNICALMDIRPDYANVEQNGQLVQVSPEELPIGSLIVVQPGEKVPLDGVIVSGQSVLDTSALTGESLPRDCGEGQEILSGCINMSGVLQIRTTKEFGDSTISKMLDLVENSSSRKSKSEDFITKFARYYTPIVCVCAVVLSVLPPLCSTLLLQNADWSKWLYRGLSFLVASCPCALVVSIPLTFFAGLGGASKAGILIKGSNYLETLAKTGTLVFDKTGTLTRGNFTIQSVVQNSMPEERLLELAALAECASSHPIAQSLLRAYGQEPDRSRVTDIQELGGYGILATVDGVAVAVGNEKLMERLGIASPETTGGTVLHVAVEGQFAGQLLLADTPKPSAAQALSSLRKSGIRRFVMLTGDAWPAARQIAAQLGIEEVYAELLPEDKVVRVEELLGQSSNGTLAFVGDGINDAPVLARADVGIAMGAMGSDAAIEAADVVLMDDDLHRLGLGIRMSRKCLRIVRQNVALALGLKCLALILVAHGLANMWLAVFADVGVLILAVLNGMRALRAR